MELPVGAELAPAAKVLGYTVLPDGEMAADSTLLRMAKCLPNKVSLGLGAEEPLGWRNHSLPHNRSAEQGHRWVPSAPPSPALQQHQGLCDCASSGELITSHFTPVCRRSRGNRKCSCPHAM